MIRQVLRMIRRVILLAKQRGFSLLEVLLAGFILFMVLASMTLVYRGALISSAKAEKSLSIAAAVPFIRGEISESLHDEFTHFDHRGSGNFGGVVYEWVATVSHEGRPSQIMQEDSGVELKYFLWRIELIVSNGNMIRNYWFREISW